MNLINSRASGSLRALFLGEATIASTKDRYIRQFYLVQRGKGTGNERNTTGTNIHRGLSNDNDSVSQTIVQIMRRG